jgi:hypothetical protein
MKYLSPLFACLLAFFAARHFRTTQDPSSPDGMVAGISGMFGKRSEPRGLARKTERLAARDFSSIASLDRLHRAGSLSPDDLRNAIREAAGRDPEGTWEWIDENYPIHQKTELLKIVASVWFNADPAAALARISTVDFYERSRLAGILISKLSDGSTEEKATVAKHLDPLIDYLGNSTSDLTLPEPSPAGADLLMSLPEGRSRDILLQHFASIWLLRDLATASAWLDQVPEPLRTSTMEQFATRALNAGSSATAASRNAAIAWLRDEAPVAIKKRLGTSLASAIAATDPKAAMEWAGQNLSSRQLADATKGIVSKLAATDLPAARGIVEGLPPGTGRNLAAASIAKHWVESEPSAAIHWWLANTGEDYLKDANIQEEASDIGNAWAAADPQSFRDFLAAPGSPDLPPAIISSAVTRLMKDREGTFDWIATLPAERREPVLKTAFTRWALDSPAEAAAAFDSRPELATGECARQIAYFWYRKDPSGAAGWVSGLPWGGLRESAMTGLRKMADYQTQSGGTVPDTVRQLLR